jgi:citrate lyase subunit beta/citryl-CoA lyase
MRDDDAMQVRPRRSVLYMPGINQRALDKARTIPADSLILDLEDSVAPEAKEEARTQVCAAVKAGGYGQRELVIRVNALETPWGAGDLRTAATAGADAVLIPKVVRPGDVVSASKVLRSAGAPEGLQIWAMMETPASIIQAREIASVAGEREVNFTCLVMGTNDLLKESRAHASGGRFAVVPWLSMTMVAARAYGLDVIDGVYNDFRDEAGLKAECEQGRTLGMDGKTLIHPAQVALTNAVFSPSPDEVDWARRIIAAFDLPENSSRGVITIDGRMVERLHLTMAERTVTIAEAIAAREAA